MFGFGKKKKEQFTTLTHPKLGELKRVCGNIWHPLSNTTIVLWDRPYEISVTFLVEDGDEQGPNEKHAKAWDSFNDIIVTRRHSIEKTILKYMECADGEGAGDRFIPRDVEFSRKGECGLYFEDTEEGVDYDSDTNTGFAVFLIPKLLFTYSEFCTDCLWGSEDTERYFLSPDFRGDYADEYEDISEKFYREQE